jgi:hypothetical protein
MRNGNQDLLQHLNYDEETGIAQSPSILALAHPPLVADSNGAAARKVFELVVANRPFHSVFLLYNTCRHQIECFGPRWVLGRTEAHEALRDGV